MPEQGDIIRQTMISEVDAVRISNSYYYVVKDNTLATTVEALAVAIHADWWSRLEDVMSEDAATTCSVWENLNGNDPTFASFQTINGAVLANNLPAESALAVAKKAVTNTGKIANAVNKLSGVAETLQRGGHLTNYEIALGAENWLTEDQTYGPTVIRNVIQSIIAEVKQYNEVELASTNPHIVSVASRQPVLCRQLA